MSHPIKTVVTFCALAALVATGCSNSPTTAVSTTTSQTQSSAVVETVTATATVTIAAEEERSYIDTFYEAEKPDDNGSFQVCGRHAGRATLITSCEFSIDVSYAQRSTGSLVLHEIESDVTHKLYDMTCAEGYGVVFRDGTDAPAILCRGGNFAEVLVFE